MKRLHVHVSVENLDQSIRFYSGLFAATPSVVKPDYAKWMLEDPRVNFAISTRGHAVGVNHLGIQVEDREELTEVYGRLKTVDQPVLAEGKATCCYHESEKSWVMDPQGIAWETFLTFGEATVYGTDTLTAAKATACCVPLAAKTADDACCVPTPAAETKTSACCS
jgi:hypothetical protein